MDVVVKVFAGILKHRLEKWEHEHGIISEYQAGFRKGYSTTDNIFNLFSIIKIKMASGKKVYGFFVDFRAAFDSIDRRALFYKLHSMGISTKFLRVLRSLYEGTMAAVWNGETMSDWFNTTRGVKQGCILSPVLFSFLLNDLHDSLGSGGIFIEELVIRVLLYADDLIILAENPEMLQRLINRLVDYCKKWNLVINLDKSKIMVFRKGAGRRANNERWFLGTNEIEVVNRYKYLGVVITPGLSMGENLSDRVKTAKISLNASWRSFLNNSEIDFGPKYELFKAVARTVCTYGAQVWGCYKYEELEKFQRYFIKSMYGIPERTPNYMITIETGLDPMYIYTLKCHMDYMHTVFHSYEDHRLPKILAKKVLAKKIFWFEEWEKLSDKFNVNLREVFYEDRVMREKTRLLLSRIALEHKRIAKNKSQESSERVYRHLDFMQGTSYLVKIRDVKKIRWIFKARGDLLGLNANPWRNGERRFCTLCNLREDENIVHFLAKCPILSEIRRHYFKVSTMQEEVCFAILNATFCSWDILYRYLIEAWRYREMLIAEYNS